MTLQFAVTEWKCRWTEILWHAASCPPWRGSSCGSCAPPFRPCCTATSAIPTTWSPTPFKTENSSLYSWSCLTTQIQTPLFRTTTVRARWTNDTENFLHDVSFLLAGTEEVKQDGIPLVCSVFTHPLIIIRTINWDWLMTGCWHFWGKW